MRLLLIVILATSAAQAEIPRSRAEVRAFRAEHACPATAQHRGPCRGFHVDHVIALCAGGADHRSNMQWISVDDHRWKTFVDVRECRKARAAGRPSSAISAPPLEPKESPRRAIWKAGQA